MTTEVDFPFSDGDMIKGKDGTIYRVTWDKKQGSFRFDKKGWMFNAYANDMGDLNDYEIVGNEKAPEDDG